MAKLTLTEASRVAGVARSTLYRAIREGRLSRDADGTIDTSELLRAGFTLQHATPPTTSDNALPLHDATRASVENLERIIATLERELEAARQREVELLALLKTAALPRGDRDGALQRFKRWFWGPRWVDRTRQ